MITFGQSENSYPTNIEITGDEVCTVNSTKKKQDIIFSVQTDLARLLRDVSYGTKFRRIQRTFAEYNAQNNFAIESYKAM